MSPGRLNMGLWEVPRPNTISAMVSPSRLPVRDYSDRQRKYWIHNPLERTISQGLVVEAMAGMTIREDT
tara:strand:- start:274 stop:480 length:207 start_codon:yes stop_codon:yes gene_type:complete